MDTHTPKADKRKTFWDAIGEPLVGENLATAGLDWEPQVVPIQYDFQGLRRQAPEHKLLINGKTGQAIAPCTDTWQPLGNREFHTIARDAVTELGGSLVRGGYIHGSKASLRVGDRCVFFVSGEIPELGFALFNDDVEESHSSRILFFNHHSPGNGMGIKVICIRKVCLNGMIKLGVRNSLKAIHTSTGISQYKRSENFIQQYKDLILLQRLQMERLTQVKIPAEEALEHFISFAGDSTKSATDQPLPVRVMQSIYDGESADMLADRGISLAVNDYTANTAYGVLQAATAFHSHLKTGHASIESAIKNKVFDESAKHTNAMFNSLVLAYSVPTKVKDFQSVSVRA